MQHIGVLRQLVGGGSGVCSPLKRMVWTAAAAVALTSAQTALAQEIDGKCAQAVGTFLTTNELQNKGKKGTSRSLLVLTNGGHVLRSDSDETTATMDHRAFGDSAGRWRCDGVADDGSIRMTMVMLNFTYPEKQTEIGQIARIDLSGRYVPKTQTLEMKGELGFVPMSDTAHDGAPLAKKATDLITISVHANKIKVPLTR